jgi:sarcosine oxidase subunit gamma
MLIMVPYADVAKILSQISKSLKDMHHLVCDVSDARTIFRVSGPAAREVLAKLAPVDLHPDSFQPGELRRTRLAQVAAAFWMCDAETFDVICFRSVADYVFGLLKTSAQPGAESDLFQGV